MNYVFSTPSTDYFINNTFIVSVVEVARNKRYAMCNKTRENIYENFKKAFKFSSPPGLCPWTSAGALPPDPSHGLTIPASPWCPLPSNPGYADAPHLLFGCEILTKQQAFNPLWPLLGDSDTLLTDFGPKHQHDYTSATRTYTWVAAAMATAPSTAHPNPKRSRLWAGALLHRSVSQKQ